jgi:hypothetical protein
MPDDPPAADSTSVVHSGCVKLSGEAVRVGAPVAPPKPEPRIELVREDGVIRAIDITCGCGEKIRVVCEYDS